MRRNCTEEDGSLMTVALFWVSWMELSCKHYSWNKLALTPPCRRSWKSFSVHEASTRASAATTRIQGHSRHETLQAILARASRHTPLYAAGWHLSAYIHACVKRAPKPRLPARRFPVCGCRRKALPFQQQRKGEENKPKGESRAP